MMSPHFETPACRIQAKSLLCNYKALYLYFNLNFLFLAEDVPLCISHVFVAPIVQDFAHGQFMTLPAALPATCEGQVTLLCPPFVTPLEKNKITR